MGFEPFRWPDNLMQIDLPDGYWVKILSEMSHYDRQQYEGRLIRIQPRLTGLLSKGEVTEADIAESTEAQLLFAEIDVLLMEINVKEWNFVDRGGDRAPIDRHHLERLSDEVGSKICSVIRERNRIRPKAKRKG